MKKQLELNSLKGYRTKYQETLASLADIHTQRKEKKEARETLLKDPHLVAAIQLHGDVETFKSSYALQLNQNKWFSEYLHVLENERNIQSIMKTVDQLNQQIFTKTSLLEQKNASSNILRENKKQLEQTVEDHKNDVVAQMIHRVQSHWLQEHDEHTPCPVCGTPFHEPASLHEAIKLQLEEVNKRLDKNEVALRDLITELNKLESDEAQLSRLITDLNQQRDELLIQIGKEETAAASDRAKIPTEIKQLNEDQASIQKKLVEELLNQHELAYKLCNVLDRLETEFIPLTTQEAMLNNTLHDLRKLAGIRLSLLDSPESSLDHRIRRVEMYLLQMKDAEEQLSTMTSQWNTKRSALENKRREKDMKLIEIRNFIPEFVVEERQTQM